LLSWTRYDAIPKNEIVTSPYGGDDLVEITEKGRLRCGQIRHTAELEWTDTMKRPSAEAEELDS